MSAEKGTWRKFVIGLITATSILAGATAGCYRHSNVSPGGKTQKKVKGWMPFRDYSLPGESDEHKYSEPLQFDPARVWAVMSNLAAGIGARPQGQAPERTAAQYLEGELKNMGYNVGWQTFNLPNGAVSQNLIAASPGTSDRCYIIVSCHIDSRPGTPGANDNASGCAVVLELARTLKGTKHFPEIKFILFGAEEDFGPS